jgi:HAD superfamily hydrolase (TIGR01509 family)
MSVAVLDIDGTLVDTNYHHAIAWYRAFRGHGIVLPIWRIHRHIGMGSDQLIETLTDRRTEHEHGDEIRASEGKIYGELIGEVQPIDGARELIEDLGHRGHAVVLASSAKAEEVDHYLDLLGARDLADAWTTSADVESTKPEPDLIRAALDRAPGPAQAAVMVGDTTWDVRAARNAGLDTITVLTGGFGADELRYAGAVAVFESVAQLREELDRTSLRGSG